MHHSDITYITSYHISPTLKMQKKTRKLKIFQLQRFSPPCTRTWTSSRARCSTHHHPPSSANSLQLLNLWARSTSPLGRPPSPPSSPPSSSSPSPPSSSTSCEWWNKVGEQSCDHKWHESKQRCQHILLIQIADKSVSLCDLTLDHHHPKY